MMCITKGPTGRGDMSLVIFRDEEYWVRSESTRIEEAWGLPGEKFISGMVWQYCLVITKIHTFPPGHTLDHISQPSLQLSKDI